MGLPAVVGLPAARVPPGDDGPHKGPPADAVPLEAELKPLLDGRKPSERVGQLYLDTASYHPAAVEAAMAAVGIDHVVFGSDFPPVGESPRPMLDVIEGLGLPQEETDKISFANARRLLARDAGEPR